MPYVINGVGTWYYGKRNIHRIKGACEFCNRIGMLSSYDTTNYFVIFFIPVIPISKYRILEECPSCEKHRAAPLKKWTKEKETSIAETLEELQSNPHDKALVQKAIGVATSFQDEALFDKLTSLTSDMTNDADVQSQLGGAYAYFGRREEAAKAYAQSLLVKDDPKTRTDLGMNFIRMGEPEKAEPQFQHVLEQKLGDDLVFTQVLIDTYQSQGKHEKALEVMDKREAAFPEFATDKAAIRQRKDSEKFRGTDKKINKGINLVDNSKTGTKEGGVSSWLAFGVSALVLLGLLTAYLGSAWYIGGNRKVYFVNRSTAPYKIKLDGVEHLLKFNPHTELRIPEGKHTVEIFDGDFDKKTFSFEIDTSFWGRPFTSPVFIVNPDKKAKVVYSTYIFSKDGKQIPPAPRTQTGMQFYTFDSVDYVFEEPPMQMRIKSSSVTKTGLSIR